MIKRKGDVFTSTAPAFGHGVNCHGAMGSGIAVPVRQKFPQNYKTYKDACTTGQLLPGGVWVTQENGLWIFNMATQNKPGADARYEAVFSAAYQSANLALKEGLDTIAIPMIGCGIGGLEWPKVERILRTTEDIVDGNFNWEVWKYDE